MRWDRESYWKRQKIVYAGKLKESGQLQGTRQIVGWKWAIPSRKESWLGFALRLYFSLTATLSYPTRIDAILVGRVDSQSDRKKRPMRIPSYSHDGNNRKVIFPRTGAELKFACTYLPHRTSNTECEIRYSRSVCHWTHIKRFPGVGVGWGVYRKRLYSHYAEWANVSAVSLEQTNSLSIALFLRTNQRRWQTSFLVWSTAGNFELIDREESSSSAGASYSDRLWFRTHASIHYYSSC